MSAFFVGQRVRIVLRRVSTYGRECTVTALGIVGNEFGRKYVGIEVDIPHPCTVGGLCVYEPDDLEPILPSSHQPAEMTVEELLPFLREQVTA